MVSAAEAQPSHQAESAVADVNVSVEKLSADWEHGLNRFGLIPAPAWADNNVRRVREDS